jgi:hypothetical protein
MTRSAYLKHKIHYLYRTGYCTQNIFLRGGGRGKEDKLDNLRW